MKGKTHSSALKFFLDVQNYKYRCTNLRIYYYLIKTTDYLKRRHKIDIVEVLFKESVSIEAEGRVNLKTPEGVYGAILGKFQTDSSKFRYLLRDYECVLSPVLEFCLFSCFELAEQAWFTIAIPLANIDYVKGKLKVRHNSKDIRTAVDAKFLEVGQKPSRPDTVYYQFSPFGLDIFTHRFSHFIITSDSCSRNAKLLVFTAQEQRGTDSVICLGFYLCSLYSERADYEQVTPLNILLPPKSFGKGR